MSSYCRGSHYKSTVVFHDFDRRQTVVIHAVEDRILSCHAPGNKVCIFYDPKNPIECQLDNVFPMLVLLGLLVAGGIAGIFKGLKTKLGYIISSRPALKKQSP